MAHRLLAGRAWPPCVRGAPRAWPLGGFRTALQAQAQVQSSKGEEGGGGGTSGGVEGRRWETVVGLEIHARVAGDRKLFSGAQSAAGAEWDGPEEANARVAAFDAALPGALPTLDLGCVAHAVRTGHALGGEVQLVSRFERKHYAYADLPWGYQITQRSAPLVRGGRLPRGGGEERRDVRVLQVQLEADTGRLEHHDGFSTVDLNRAGCGLMEIVTAPDLRSGKEAADAVRELQVALRLVGSCDGQFETGSLRVDVNVSVREVTSGGDGGEDGVVLRQSPRVEIKNVNSLRSIRRAVEAEEVRLRALAAPLAGEEAGSRPPVETRSFEVATGTTRPGRLKDSDEDYRFLPEPDLPPLVLSADQIRAWVARGASGGPPGDVSSGGLLELPEEAVQRLATSGVSLLDARTLVNEPGGLVYTDAVLGSLAATAGAGAKDDGARATALALEAGKWITGPLLRGAAEASNALPSNAPLLERVIPVTPRDFAGLVALVNADKVPALRVARALPVAQGKDLLKRALAGAFEASPPLRAAHDADPADGGGFFGKAAASLGMIALGKDAPADPFAGPGEALAAAAASVLAAHPDVVGRFRQGHKGAFNYLLGMLMRATGGAADPADASRALSRALDDTPA